MSEHMNGNEGLNLSDWCQSLLGLTFAFIQKSIIKFGTEREQ